MTLEDMLPRFPPYRGTELHEAIAAADLPRIHELLATRADLEALDSLGVTPLMTAVSEEQAETVSLLISAGANMDTHRRVPHDDDGRPYGDNWTAMHLAAEPDLVDVLCLLIERGAKIDPRDDQGQTPFTLAIDEIRSPRCALKLLEHGAAVSEHELELARHYRAELYADELLAIMLLSPVERPMAAATLFGDLFSEKQAASQESD